VIDSSLHHFDTVAECDRHTHTETDRRPGLG